MSLRRPVVDPEQSRGYLLHFLALAVAFVLAACGPDCGDPLDPDCGDGADIDVTGVWEGTSRDDSSEGTGWVVMSLVQDGKGVTGSFQSLDELTGISMSGTVTGTVNGFNFVGEITATYSFGGSSCSAEASFDLQASESETEMDGTYDGRSTCGGLGTGELTLTQTRVSPLPNAPSDLTATAMGTNQIDLSWTDNSDEEDEFRIERKLSSTSSWTQIATAGADVTTYGDTGLESGTSYDYKVRACSADDCSAYSDAATATTQTGQLSFLSQPSDVDPPDDVFPAGYRIYPAIEVGVPSGWTTDVTLTLGTDPCGGATLTGGGPVTPVDGTAVFEDVVLDAVCDGYTLVATSDGLTDAESNPFNITIPGDLNLDDRVDQIDQYQLVELDWGKTTYPPSDIDKDGSVDVTDLGIQTTNWTGGVMVTTEAPTDVQSTSATLNGTVSSPEAGEAWIEWSTSSDLVGAAATERQAVTAGARNLAFSIPVSGLTASTTYYYRAAIETDDGIAKDNTENIQSFTTTTSPSLVFLSQPSDVDPPDDVFPAGYRIYPAIEVGVPSGWTTDVSLTLGTDSCGGATLTGGGPVTPVDGTAVFENVVIDAVCDGYTLVATSDGLESVESNPFNITIPGDFDPDSCVDQDDLDVLLELWGSAGAHTRADIDKSRTVDSIDLGILLSHWTAPAASEPTVTNVTTSTATFSGTANPNGTPSTAWFEWSTDPGFAQFDHTVPVQIGSGTDPVQITEDIAGLQPGTTYYVRVAAVNAEGCLARGNAVSYATP